MAKKLKEDIQKIITYGTKAPSGENYQPWRFEVKGNIISVINIPERDTSLYGWGQRASYLAHGALLENMSIASSALGYKMAVKLFPDQSNPNLVANVYIEKTQPRPEPLFPAIDQRVTNRKPYKKTPLDAQDKNKLLAINQNTEGVKIALAEYPEKIRELAKAASKNEKILFENRDLHNFFFSHINWTKEEDREKSIGFYIKTLELPPPARLGFKLFKHWPILNLLDKIGLANMVAAINSTIYSSASAMGIIVIKNVSAQDYIAAGKIMERVWLTATNLGLNLQPMTGILFLRLRILAGETAQFSPRHIELIKNVYEKIKDNFKIRDSHIAMLFRLGRGEKPSARSSRLRPDIKWL